MAVERPGATIPGVEASADLTGQQFRFVNVDGEDTVDLASAGGVAVGVLQNKPDVGQAATVWSDGSTTKVVAEGAVPAGSNVAVGAAAGAVVAAAGNYIQGRCINGAANAGELITLQISKDGRQA